MSDIVIGTRGSPLALWQANWIKELIEKEHNGVTVGLEIIHTKGDKILDTPLALVGGKGLFVKELENALLDGSVDIAVHSMKDVPTELPEGLSIASVAKREDPRDALVSRAAPSFAELPRGARVGTSSLRRQTQILNRRPDINIVPLRGNVGTRLRKLADENLDAIILAVAGLVRMGKEDVITEYMAPEDSLPAVAQGAVGVEARLDDIKIASLIQFLDDDETRVAVETERAFLSRLEGGCQVPIAAFATVDGESVSLEGLVGAIDGSVIYRDSRKAHACNREKLGVELAETLLSRGAGKILEEAYGEK